MMESNSESEEDFSSNEEEGRSEVDSSSESESENSDVEVQKQPKSKHSLISQRVGGTRTKNMSLEELIKMRDRIGTKQFNQQVLKSGKNIKTASKHGGFKRENKNRPQELSSKARVPKMREVLSWVSTYSKANVHATTGFGHKNFLILNDYELLN